MMRYSIGEILNEKQCYDYLSKTLHPDGLHCPDGHSLPPDQAPHDRHRDPLFDYRCKICGKVFNIFTDTIWSGSRYSCITIVLILRGIVQGVPTMHLAEELGIDRTHLLNIRHYGLWPARLLLSMDSPGKNTGVGCHFLLQCRKVKSESEVAHSCLTLSDPMDCSLPGSSIHQRRWWRPCAATHWE